MFRMIGILLVFIVPLAQAAAPLRVYIEPMRLEGKAAEERISEPARVIYDAFREALGNRPGVTLVNRVEWDAGRTRSNDPAQIMKDLGIGLMLRFEYDADRLDGAKNAIRIDVFGPSSSEVIGSRPFRLEKKLDPALVETLIDTVLALRFQKILTPKYAVESGEREQRDISVSDSGVAWIQRESDREWQICFLKEIGGRPAAVGKPYPKPVQFALGNRYLVVIEAGHIVAAYSTDTLARKVISDTATRKSDVTTSEDRFVWIEPNPKAANVIVAQIGKGSPTALDPSPRNQQQPFLKGDLLTWSDARDGSWDVYVHDFSTGETTAVATGPESQYLPAVSGNYVVYQSKGKGNLAVNLYNSRTRSTTTVVESSEPIGRPSIYGTTIVYQKLNTLDLRPRGKGRAKTFDIAVYDLMSKKERILAGDSYDQQNPVIGATHVFWEHATFRMESRSPIDTVIGCIPYPFPE